MITLPKSCQIIWSIKLKVFLSTQPIANKDHQVIILFSGGKSQKPRQEPLLSENLDDFEKELLDNPDNLYIDDDIDDDDLFDDLWEQKKSIYGNWTSATTRHAIPLRLLL